MASDFLNTATQRHQIHLQRLATHEANTFNETLKEADKIVRDVLSRHGEFISTKAILDEIMRELTLKLGAEYAAWGEDLLDDMMKIGGQEADFTAKTLEKAVVGATVATVTAQAVWTAANIIPVQVSDKGESALMQAIVKQFTPNQVQRVTGVVRNGFYAGTPTQAIITQIRGTKVNQFKDGVLITTQRNAASIAKTLTNHMSNIARTTTFKKNKNILKGWEFSATLDNRTSSICRHNDGEVFPIGSGPVPPLHIACRSAQVPVLKKKFDIFKGEGTRASKGASGGKQVKNQTYYEWLQTQPKFFQQEVLGKTQTELFRKGGLTTDQFRKLVNDRMGEPLNLEEIKRKNATAWETAGLDGD